MELEELEALVSDKAEDYSVDTAVLAASAILKLADELHASPKEVLEDLLDTLSE